MSNRQTRSSAASTGKPAGTYCPRRALIPAIGRLPAVEGRVKISKSQGKAILLSASDAEIAAGVQQMYAHPDHLLASGPGRIEGNVVFTYLDAFGDDREAVPELNAQYRRGGLGGMVVKLRLDGMLRRVVGPVRERCAALVRDPDYLVDVLWAGTAHAREVTAATQAEVHADLAVHMEVATTPATDT